MDRNYTINKLQQRTQQQLVHQPQQVSLPLQHHPIQYSDYGIIPAEHTTYSAPSLMDVQPSQPNPSVTNDSTTKNNIGKRHSEGEQEIDNETATKYTWHLVEGSKETHEERHTEIRTGYLLSTNLQRSGSFWVPGISRTRFLDFAHNPALLSRVDMRGWFWLHNSGPVTQPG
jgi:hypothetical protein